jgi:hypothetical protein
MEPTIKVSFWARLEGNIRRHRALSIVALILIVLIIAALVVFILYVTHPKSAKTATVVSKPAVIKKVVPPTIYYSPLTGEVVSSLAATTQPVTAVMIENSPDARPQSGLKEAGVVFEAIAEGGITRFMAIYQQEKPQLIGPVRSLRIYDIDWFTPFDASIAHVGGSAAALAEVRNGSFRDIDQFFNGSYYYRSTDRLAPHNVYTTSADLDNLNASKGYTSSDVKGFLRTTGTASTKPTATAITIDFSIPLYNTSYTYDAANNDYPRSQDGAPHLDREEGQIAPTVVIAMDVAETTVLQDGYREAITTIGSGDATIFQNGTATKATWTKTAQDSQITFTDSTGKDIALDRGQTWIAAVPNGEGSVSWQ